MVAIPETQFSIYKIDYDLIEEKFNIVVPRTDKKYPNAVITALINSVAAILEKKSADYYKFSNKGFVGMVFKTVHRPAWREVAEQLLSDKKLSTKDKDNLLSNTNVSYVFFYQINEKIFACTGGYGSNYINKFVVKNFGLYLLPKMIKPNNQVVKNVLQNNLIGNQTSTNKVNRNNTSVSNEHDMSSIFRLLTVEASRTIAESMGVVFDSEESETKKTNIINKDSLVIKRSFTLQELIVILENISDIEEKEDSFALNYMILARKKGIKNAELNEKLISDFFEGELSKFTLIGDDYEQYYINAFKYRLIDADNDIILLEKDEPISINEVVNLTKNKDGKTTKSAINKMLKHWEISTVDNNGNPILYPIPIIDAIQGFVEFGANNLPCYLFNNNWYVFDKQYESMLTNEFENFFDENEKLSNKLKNHWNLKNTTDNEEAYNEELAKRDNLIVSHKATLGNIEIADVIFKDNDTVYFMHNKKAFNGSGARDLTNQILAAAEYFQIKRMSMENMEFYKEYFKKIKHAAEKNNRCLSIDEHQFAIMLAGAKQFCFVAGYLNDYRRDSRATYAKYLSIELKKKLISKGFNCCVIGLE